ncbi:MAG: chaperone modulator CbpM [Alphaproteobacteria bacterium]|jgi:chaperone modulatory protein CbpM
MRESELLKTVSNVRRVELRRWVEKGWVVPERRDGEFWFREIDVARVQLVIEMRRDLAIAEDGIPTVLSLVDQVYGLRNQLRQLGEAIQAQPGDVRKAIADRLRPDD